VINDALDDGEQLALSERLPIMHIQRLFPCQIAGVPASNPIKYGYHKIAGD
jgi:hypothetical protein